MHILENGKFRDDNWHFSAQGDNFQDGNICYSAQEIDRAIGRNSKGKIGILIKPDESVDKIRPYLSKLHMVCLEFHSFSDGRAFSQARYLREICGYKGIIRVRGNCLPDQYGFLLRCGVNQIAMSSSKMEKEWQEHPQFFSVAYQPSTLNEKPNGPLFRRSLNNDEK